MSTCPNCWGKCIVVTCLDDTCIGQGYCDHGDGEEMCPVCHGEGETDEEEWWEYEQGLEEL